ncbi:mitochondrial import inner membrane translocase subunit TIM44, putative [Plasmodium knowlesi strain H]|uniref:Mitochondrial import inner membrane translocase subunit TIM44, putative n=3 Tax=Plasmodium knowlesi TaxID=5850 RepID=A0A5K1U5P7_PLAKH|nr:mitochondrial import inner membrane translocase subunit TIM44, putative [Plasmodium knowlesi strain H]OTN65227.1 putative Mitochondrial import inner membrane translocase subunit TIM44 [Plasmodium knowlesi]CAA9988280.1 mitochondrial import inner membrane translocase subunit TIM44, putative [Plasmodium knowlesi strain H]SBO20220.1 mitochondrial import inner membrane translocase subunit TIM44, putative [Plasmodium knowlesi strain H]SBO20374.1 mitochondrial import inner membrane translocase subu|eukprot:XP_002259257.1 Mitochondrial import inner membrane translocase,putative [Plasmodium knowlesi strain H]
MRSILNSVFVVNQNVGKNAKCRRFISGSSKVKSIFDRKYVFKGTNYFLWSDVRNAQRGAVHLTGENKKFFSTFMKNVIDQVKKDMKENKQYQEALKELKEKTEIDHKAVKLKKKIRENINLLKHIKEKNEEAVKLVCNDVNNFIHYCFENYTIFRFSKNASVKFFLILQKFLLCTSNKLTELADKWNEKNNAFVKLDKWRQEMAIRRYKKSAHAGSNVDENTDKSNDLGTGEKGDHPNQSNTESAKRAKNSGEHAEEVMEEEKAGSSELVLAQESAWDKFGSKLKDMPFLNNFFENPILGKLFGETELAAALREMKMYDQNFKLSELMYLFEFVISKHIVESYLIGDEETLRVHCGQSAFNSLNASINERKKKKVYLDTNVLIYKNHELKGAQRMEESSPWFIFTFHTQQINCLKNANDEIIEGNIDDIREVVYTIALSKHPEPEREGLLYPYIVREFAIIGNTPSW